MHKYTFIWYLAIGNKKWLTVFVLFLLASASIWGDSVQFRAGIDWEQSEKARIFDKVLPFSPVGGFGSPLFFALEPSQSTMFRSDIQGPLLSLGFLVPVEEFEISLNGSYSFPGGLRGPLTDSDYLKLNEGPTGIRHLPGGPNTGDSVYSSSPTLDTTVSKLTGSTTKAQLEFALGARIGHYSLDSVFRYTESRMDAQSDGQTIFYGALGPRVVIAYAPLSYSLVDFERGAGLRVARSWKWLSWTIKGTVAFGYLDQNSSFHNYTRNLTLYWNTHGLYAAGDLALWYHWSNSDVRIYGRFAMYRSSSIGTSSLSLIGGLTAFGQGFTNANLPSIARIEERRSNIEIGIVLAP